jgi:transposase
MRFIQNLGIESISLLNRIYKHSKHHQVRQRAQCILLSHQDYSTSTLMDIFGVTRLTLYNWFDSWETRGFAGLYNRPGRGRKPTFTPEQQEQIKQWAKDEPKNLGAVRARVKKTWDVVVSKTTLKRVIKTMGMSWHRIRKRLSGKPDAQEYQRKKEELEALKQADQRGEIDLRYLDEAGFCLMGYVPYGWQLKGEELFIEVQRSKRLNAVGIMNRSNELEVYLFEGSINSDVLIGCIDKFVETINQPTVITIDNAPIHTSRIFEEKIEEWKQKQLEIFFLPSYSPQLNLIEILWRFIKYEWIEIEAYSSWESLVEYVEKVLRGFGTEYIINFA